MPVQQFRVLRQNGKPAFVDLAYPDARVAIEVDGWDAHGRRNAFDADRARANDLTLLGWRVLRFTSRMSDASILRTIRDALGLTA
jgi:very-short-patch-repair endonuclease